jgi:hypothetical protein
MLELIKNLYRPKKRPNFREKPEIYSLALKLFTKHTKKNMTGYNYIMAVMK